MRRFAKGYQRRIDRFRKLRERGRDPDHLVTLFVYAANATAELLQAQALLQVLQELYGPRVYLCLLLDSQPADGAFFFEGAPGLQLCTLAATHGHSGRDEYNIMEPPYVTAYHKPIMEALQHASGGPRPSPHVVLPSLRGLVHAALDHGDWPVRHVSLGEDLATSMSHDPHLPCDEAFRHALLPAWRPQWDLIWAACQAHFAAIGGVHLPEDDEHGFVALRRWRTCFAAAMFAHKVLGPTSVLPKTSKDQMQLPSSTLLPRKPPVVSADAAGCSSVRWAPVD